MPELPIFSNKQKLVENIDNYAENISFFSLYKKRLIIKDAKEQEHCDFNTKHV